MPEQTPDIQENICTPNLSELSPRDKPWDKHRSNADKVSAYYAGSEFQDYSEVIAFTSAQSYWISD